MREAVQKVAKSPRAPSQQSTTKKIAPLILINSKTPTSKTGNRTPKLEIELQNSKTANPKHQNCKLAKLQPPKLQIRKAANTKNPKLQTRGVC